MTVSTSPRIPTADVPLLVLKCYHAAVLQGTELNRHVLVDPAPGTLQLLQQWRNDGWAYVTEGDDCRGLRHLEIHDRNGVHRYVCQRPGFSMCDLKNAIHFDCRTDYASVQPNPGVEDLYATPDPF